MFKDCFGTTISDDDFTIILLRNIKQINKEIIWFQNTKHSSSIYFKKRKE